jgi:hypothetical protein
MGLLSAQLCARQPGNSSPELGKMSPGEHDGSNAFCLPIFLLYAYNQVTRIERIRKRDVMKDMKTLAVLCVALLIVCSPGATARAEGHHQSGVVGQVVWAELDPNPFYCFVSVVTDSGKAVTALETDANGAFRVALKPGTYLLTPFLPLAPGGAVAMGQTQRVRVEKKDYTMVVMPFTISITPFPGWPNIPLASRR